MKYIILAANKMIIKNPSENNGEKISIKFIQKPHYHTSKQSLMNKNCFCVLLINMYVKERNYASYIIKNILYLFLMLFMLYMKSITIKNIT